MNAASSSSRNLREPRRLAFAQEGENALDQLLRLLRLFVLRADFLFQLRQAALQTVEVREHQLGLDRVGVGDRVDLALDMNNIVVLEAADDIGHSVDLADHGEELIAEAFALGGAAHQAGNIDEGEARRDDLRGLADRRQRVEPLVRHGHVADIGLDGAERVIGCGRGRGLRQRVEQGGLADIRQSDNAAFEAHYDDPNQRRSMPASAPSCGLGSGSALLALGDFDAGFGFGFCFGFFLGLHRVGDARLELVVLAACQILRLARDGAEQRFEPGMIGFRKILQHVMHDLFFPARMADADAHADIIVAEMGGHRFQAVMPGDAAAGLHPHLAGGEVELVVEHDHVVELELVEVHGFLSGLARLVHEGAGFQHDDFFAAELAFARPALKAFAPGREVVRRGNRVERHEADIVPVERILRPRIAEADEQFHEAP